MAELKDINELLYGQEVANKTKRFKEGMLEIEKKYSKYFEERKSKYDPNKNDRLHNHCGTINDSKNISFSFYPESDLDENIKSECQDLFNQIFN